jgi:hypothetical protein
MKRRFALIVLFTAFCTTGVFAQFAQLEKDFSKFLLLLGREMLPEIQQNDLAGTGIGQASMGDSRFFIAFTGGAVISNGILKFIDENNTNFEALDLYGLIDDAVPDSGAGRDLYDESKNIFPYPTLKLSAGFRLYDLDFIVSGIMLPGAVGNSISEDLEMSVINLGLRVRKALIKESGGFPTISLGAGYVYSAIHFKYAIEEFEQDYAGQPLVISGDFGLDTQVHSFGVDLGISKTLLWFLTPFVRTSVWYQSASFEADGLLSAQLGAGAPTDLSPSAKATISDVAVIVSGGLDINLFLMRLCTTGTYNLNTGSWGAELALRVQF